MTAWPGRASEEVSLKLGTERGEGARHATSWRERLPDGGTASAKGRGWARARGLAERRQAGAPEWRSRRKGAGVPGAANTRAKSEPRHAWKCS